MKKIILTLVLCIPIGWVEAQESCEDKVQLAKKFIQENSPFNDGKKIFDLVSSCAQAGEPVAQNYMGMLYLNGIGIAQNHTQAFHYFSSAAALGDANAQHNLGRMYKQGLGCDIDLEQAVYWFRQSAINGSARGGFLLGYMYYKGFAVPQDYETAIQWFKRSGDYMSTHFLGICYYFGYGVAADEDRALELLLNNPIKNSQTFLTYIRKEQKANIEAAVESELNLNDRAPDSTYIATEAMVAPMVHQSQSTPMTIAELEGAWTGKLVQYDWSGQLVERIIPIAMKMTASGQNVVIKTTLTDQLKTSTARWEDEKLYLIDSLDFTLDKLYASYANEPTFDYRTLAIGLEKQTVGAYTYLIGYVDTYVDAWTEYGQPMRIILKPLGQESSDAQDEAMLSALAAQNEQFIKLYPVPFDQQLTIQYDLEVGGQVNLKLVNMTDYTTVSIVDGDWQDAGAHTFRVDQELSTLEKGIYVVRLAIGDQLYTRTVIKE